MPRSLADGHTKFVLMTIKPAGWDTGVITDTEFNAGVDASCNVMSSDFAFGATDSDKVAEKALCVTNNANSLGAGNYTAGATFFRYFDDTGASATAEGDDSFQAVKEKGTTLYAAARKTSKLSTAPGEAGDEIYLAAEILTDTPQPPSDQGGYIKWRVPMEVQTAFDNVVLAAGA
ncbi:hypothetical protein [Segeticoccus rhizosphaerae]|uniref:phage tail tube protein n=1 Tax=Segeticoccus rhizosphaerae TaxID=1104777 RepID=UPI00126535CD|nr:hypothetical protein [Segeticoccus rhizosphaerae]